MVQEKVNKPVANYQINQELDDLKTIVNNCFEQINQSFQKAQLSLAEANAKSTQLSPTRATTTLALNSPKAKVSSVLDEAALA